MAPPAHAVLVHQPQPCELGGTVIKIGLLIQVGIGLRGERGGDDEHEEHGPKQHDLVDLLAVDWGPEESSAGAYTSSNALAVVNLALVPNESSTRSSHQQFGRAGTHALPARPELQVLCETSLDSNKAALRTRGNE